MEETTRVASPPATGAMRDAVRTVLAFGVMWLLARLVGEDTASGMIDAVNAIVVVIVSALFAFVGKVSRDDGNPIGKIV